MSDDFHDEERDKRKASVDPTSYERSSAEQASRGCRHCGGQGLATVYDPNYDGAAIITTVYPDGSHRKRPGRVMAYCICLLGRWIENNHRQHAGDVHKRTPDFAEIYGRSSYWLENDPTERDLTSDEAAALPENWRNMVIRRANATP